MKVSGVKGLEFASALFELGKYTIYDTFVGTSAGAITATLLGAVYSLDESVKIIRKRTLQHLKMFIF